MAAGCHARIHHTLDSFSSSSLQFWSLRHGHTDAATEVSQPRETEMVPEKVVVTTTPHPEFY